MDNAELLRRYAEDRSEEAFTELVQRNLDLVFSAALRQVGGDAHRAQEVAQQVFTDLARKAPTLAGHTALTGWLYTSTHFAAAKLRRTEQRRQAHEQEAFIMNELLGSADSAENWEQLRPVLDEVMHELSPRDREAILLRFFEQRSFNEVGQHLGLGENAARMSVERALDKLGGLLAKRGVNSTASALAILLANQTVAAAPGGLAATIASGALAPVAAASAGGGAVAGVINFMSTTKLSIGLAAAGILAVGTGAFYAVQTARAEALLASLDRDADGMLARLRELQRRIAAAGAVKPAAAAITAVPAAATAVASVAAPAAQGVTAEQAQEVAVKNVIRRNLFANPQFNQLKVQRGVNDLGTTWRLFCRSLGLSAEKTAQFESVLANSVADAWRERATSQTEGRDRNDPVRQQREEQARVRLEDNLRGLLGEAGLQRFLDYERASAATDFTWALATRVYLTETPLTSEQAVQVTDILMRHSPDFRDGKGVNLTRLEWDKALAAAQGILAPLQFGALQGLRAQQDYYAALAAARKRLAGGKSP